MDGPTALSLWYVIWYLNLNSYWVTIKHFSCCRIAIEKKQKTIGCQKFGGCHFRQKCYSRYICIPFASNIARGTGQALHFLSPRLIFIDEISMLTPWIAQLVSLTLGWISDVNHHHWDFGRGQLFFISDLLQVPPVLKKMTIPLARRMIMRFLWWGFIQKFIFRTPQRYSNFECATFLSEVPTGELKQKSRRAQVRDAFNVTLTTSPEEAPNYLCRTVHRADRFPLDRLWISATNRLVTEINPGIQ
jgi:hypothetical protein